MPATARARKRTSAAAPAERIILRPEERLETVLNVIRGAKKRLILSVFRCDEFKVLDEIAETLSRGVQVEILFTRRAKGWSKRLKSLVKFLRSMGAKVYRFGDRVVKYHAKYVVADDGPALVGSLNFTKKCFSGTCDFMQLTYDPAVVSGLKKLFEADSCATECSFPDGISERLIVGPDPARAQFTSLLESASRSIGIVDHKLTDPAILSLLRAKRAAGVAVQIVKRGPMAGLMPHGKLILVDERTAVIGSIALSALSMDFRREVALMIHTPQCVAQLNEFFQVLAEEARQRPKKREKAQAGPARGGAA